MPETTTPPADLTVRHRPGYPPEARLGSCPTHRPDWHICPGAHDRDQLAGRRLQLAADQVPGADLTTHEDHADAPAVEDATPQGEQPPLDPHPTGQHLPFDPDGSPPFPTATAAAPQRTSTPRDVEFRPRATITASLDVGSRPGVVELVVAVHDSTDPDALAEGLRAVHDGLAQAAQVLCVEAYERRAGARRG